MNGKSLIIIPTYNELDNIQKLTSELLNTYDENLHILVVDDNSPDGTGNFVENLTKENSRVHLLKRQKKMGLGTAYVEGFKFAIEKKYDFIFEMDADFSHDPKEIPNFLKAINDFDLIIGSRYLNGVNVINWPIQRLLLSVFANKYTRLITGLPVNDSTGGFKCFRRKVLESIDFSNVKSNGYAFQIEINYKVWRYGFRIGEIPIIFVDRRSGKSKMSRKIVREAALLVWKLRFRNIFGVL